MIKNALLLSVTLFCLIGCASTEYQAYEGRNTVFQGEGGTKRTVEGIDFWENGEPPRKFKVLGIVDDTRGAGLIPMAMRDKAIAEKAKKQGADAVILISSSSRYAGSIASGASNTNFYGNSATTYGSGTSTAVFKNSAKYVAIKYL